MGIIQRQGLKNTIVTFAGILLGFVSLLYIQPKFLSAEEIGLTRVLFSLSSLVGVFLPLGIGVITVKYFPVFRDTKTGHNGFFGLILLFMLVGCVFVGLLLFLFKSTFISTYQEQSRQFVEFYYLVLPFSFLIGLNAVLTLYCNSLFKSTFPAIFNEILVRILSIVLFTIYFIKLINIQLFILLFVGIYGLQSLALLTYILKVDNPSLKINWEKLKNGSFQEMLTFGIWMSFISVASLGIKFIDSLIIAKYFKLELVGIYAIAAFIPNIIEAPMHALDRIAGTKIAHALSVNDYDEIKKIYYKSATYLLIIGGLIFVGITANIQYLLAFLPPKYMGGLDVVYIISIGALFNIAGGANSQIIFSSNNFWKGGMTLIGVVVLALILNIVLIPKFGITGAALATCISAFTYFIAKFFIVYKNFKLQPYNFETLKVILLILCCSLLGYAIPTVTSPFVNIITHSLLVGGLYIAGCFAMNLVPDASSLLVTARNFLNGLIK